MMTPPVERKPFRRPRLVGAMVGLVGLMASLPLIAGDISFRPRQQMRVAGRLKEVRSFDFEGEGRRDIVALSEVREGKRSRWEVSLFVQSERGRFREEPDRVVGLDSAAAVIAPLSLGESRERVLAAVSPGGVFAVRLDEGGDRAGPIRLAALETPVAVKVDGGPIFCDAIRDWDGDGLDEMVVADFSGLSLLTFAGPGRLTPTARIEVLPGLRVYHRGGGSNLRRDVPVSFRYDFPVVTPGEYNGDAKPDLFIRTEERLAVSVQVAKGDYRRPVVVREISRPFEEDDGDDVEVLFGLADFNGDGLTDVSEAWWKGTGLTGTRAEIRLFLGGAGGFGGRPDQVIEVEDALPSLLLFEDLDGDGRDEMIVPTMELGLMSFVRILTSGMLRIKARIFDDDPAGVFEDEPRYVHQVSARIDLSGQRNLASGYGDFNHDGKLDFVFGTRRDEVSVFEGMGGRGNLMFSRKPVVRLSEDSNGFVRIDDIDGNGKEDILLYYPSKGTILVYCAVD